MSETARVAEELARIRSTWVEIGPSDRCSALGTKLSKRYRKLSLEFWHLTGKHPPPVYADL